MVLLVDVVRGILSRDIARPANSEVLTSIKDNDSLASVFDKRCSLLSNP